MFCSKCNSDNSEENKFCIECGNPLNKNIQTTSREDNVETNIVTSASQHKITTVQWIFISVFVLFVIGSCSDKSDSPSATNSNPSLSRTDKQEICKSYISQLFGRPASIMKASFIKEDSGFFSKISYVRSSDNTTWNNVCHIDGDTILWASIGGDGIVGRWRFEDERKIINGKVTY
ncbi:zinc-ribbon domain-containing protein [Pseudoalteromonas sp. SCQQ13]|uniref:zinc-ribbon domain-containing protein n=1 Tax=Pseudoalteromonas sp. SCQQ13 TaxID=2792066 RepID=UPI0018CE86BF|nr:zinc-ribbon domain-containing protein [Pseudoalteromonas sp. SCQQ13]MBH0093348.1 hypothetical protein [Pseudoalteromonas sp. SCQQ13]